MVPSVCIPYSKIYGPKVSVLYTVNFHGPKVSVLYTVNFYAFNAFCNNLIFIIDIL